MAMLPDQLVRSLLKMLGVEPDKFLAELQRFVNWATTVLKTNDDRLSQMHDRLMRIENATMMSFFTLQRIESHLTLSPPELATQEPDPELIALPMTGVEIPQSQKN